MTIELSFENGYFSDVIGKAQILKIRSGVV